MSRPLFLRIALPLDQALPFQPDPDVHGSNIDIINQYRLQMAHISYTAHPIRQSTHPGERRGTPKARGFPSKAREFLSSLPDPRPPDPDFGTDFPDRLAERRPHGGGRRFLFRGSSTSPPRPLRAGDSPGARPLPGGIGWSRCPGGCCWDGRGRREGGPIRTECHRSKASASTAQPNPRRPRIRVGD